MSCYRLHLSVGCTLEHLVHDDLLNAKHDTINAFNANRSTALLNSFLSVFYLEHTTVWGERRGRQIVLIVSLQKRLTPAPVDPILNEF